MRPALLSCHHVSLTRAGPWSLALAWIPTLTPTSTLTVLVTPTFALALAPEYDVNCP